MFELKLASLFAFARHVKHSANLYPTLYLERKVTLNNVILITLSDKKKLDKLVIVETPLVSYLVSLR